MFILILLREHRRRTGARKAVAKVGRNSQNGRSRFDVIGQLLQLNDIRSKMIREATYTKRRQMRF